MLCKVIHAFFSLGQNATETNEASFVISFKRKELSDFGDNLIL
jgi:hypothetical protein